MTESGPVTNVQWRNVPVGAVVLYGVPREVLVNDPWGAQRTVMLDGIPAIYPRGGETVQLLGPGHGVTRMRESVPVEADADADTDDDDRESGS